MQLSGGVEQSGALSCSDFLTRAYGRLQAAGYRCSANTGPFLLAAHHSGFELFKFGNLDRSFLFARFPTIEQPTQLAQFSAAAFQAALDARGWRPPRGLGEGVFAHAVAVVEWASDPLLRAVRMETAPKHWSALESRVLFDVRTQQLVMFDNTALWGGAYWPGERKLVRSLLG